MTYLIVVGFDKKGNAIHSDLFRASADQIASAKKILAADGNWETIKKIDNFVSKYNL